MFGRFEATRPNELWTGDALHGPAIGGRKTYLFCFIDDHSRAVMGARWAFHEDVVRLAAALRPALAIARRPRIGLRRQRNRVRRRVAAARLRGAGHQAGPLPPRRPQGRGKIERFFRTVRDQFLVEITGRTRQPPPGPRSADLAELNRLFGAWVEAATTARRTPRPAQPPLARWQHGVPEPLPLPSPAQLREAFLWSERRTVRKTATVSLHGNLYQVDASLARRMVELVFDPFDLTASRSGTRGSPPGTAVPFTIGRHAHAKARAGDAQPARRAGAHRDRLPEDPDQRRARRPGSAGPDQLRRPHPGHPPAPAPATRGQPEPEDSHG